MVERVSYEVGQRIAYRFNDRFVQFDVFAFYYKLSFLTSFLAEIPDQPVEFVEDYPDGLHACGHYRFLEFSGYQVYSLHGLFYNVEILSAGTLEELVSCQYQFSGEAHQLVEQCHVDPDAAGIDFLRFC